MDEKGVTHPLKAIHRKTLSSEAIGILETTGLVRTATRGKEIGAARPAGNPPATAG